MTILRTRRTWMWAAVLLASLLVACGPGGICEDPADQRRREEEQQRVFELLRQRQVTPVATTATAATAAPATTASAGGTSAPAKAAAPGASGATPASAAPTAAAGTPKATGTPSPTAAASPYGGKLGLGYDHPPFAAGNDKGGASSGIVCGALTGVAGGSTVTVNLTGGTGAPATVTGPVTGDGAFMIPFAINSYGPLNASIGGIRTAAGTSLTGTVAPAALDVGDGPDVACSPR